MPLPRLPFAIKNTLKAPHSAPPGVSAAIPAPPPPPAGRGRNYV